MPVCITSRVFIFTTPLLPKASFNAAIHAGVVGTVWRGTSNDVEGGLAVGYASSLRAQANGADVAGLDGLLLTASVGLGFR